MRFLYALIGLLFDVVMLAAAIAGLQVAVAPQRLDQALEYIRPLLDSNNGRLQIGGGAIVLLILSLRALFLLMFGRRGDPEFVIHSGDTGDVTISQSSLNRVLARIVGEKTPGGEMRSGAVTRNGEKFDIRIRVRLDLVKTNLNDYTAALEERIREHFTATLGIPLGAVRIQAECSPDTPK